MSSLKDKSGAALRKLANNLETKFEELRSRMVDRYDDATLRIESLETSIVNMTRLLGGINQDPHQFGIVDEFNIKLQRLDNDIIARVTSDKKALETKLNSTMVGIRRTIDATLQQHEYLLSAIRKQIDPPLTLRERIGAAWRVFRTKRREVV